MKRRILPLFLLLLTASGFSQGDPVVLEKIIREGKHNNKVMEHMRYITKRIGPRLTGSPQMKRAAEWTAQKFREFGLQNVQLDQWGEVPVGFDRGPTQIGMMTLPYERRFQFTTPAWTPGTNGAVTALAVRQPTTMEELNAMRDKLKGAWVIMATPVTMRGPGGDRTPREVIDAMLEAGIAGRVYGSSNELIHTHGSFRDVTWENLPKHVQIIIRKSDMDAVKQALTAERETRLTFHIDNRFIQGPMPQYNVVAEIPGTEKPDEVVIFGGHLDSWNGPGSEGASDNATGTMSMLEAARILMKVGVKPKRTIRFILFGGEEQGLLGSRAYAEKYKASMGKIMAVFVDDGGSNYQGGVTATADMAPILERAMAPMNQAFPDLPVKVTVVQNFPRGGGSDHMSFTAQGVPGFFFHETGRQEYQHVWHTQNDVLENVIPEYLVQSSTNSAVMAYNLACAPELLPRLPAAAGGSGRGGGGGDHDDH